jgi:hypothetical protein
VSLRRVIAQCVKPACSGLHHKKDDVWRRKLQGKRIDNEATHSPGYPSLTATCQFFRRFDDVWIGARVSRCEQATSILTKFYRQAKGGNADIEAMVDS